MGLEQFNEVIIKLQSNERLSIVVFDITNGMKPLFKYLTAEYIITKFGSLDAFFSSIFSTGITEIGIKFMKPNGVSNGRQNWAETKDPFLRFSSEVQPKFDQVHTQKENRDYKEEGSLNIPYDRYTDLKYDAKEYLRIKEEFAKLEEKYKRTKRKLNKYRDAEKTDDKEFRKMQETTKRMDTALQKGAPIIAPILEKLAGLINIPEQGLSNPGQQKVITPNVSPLKQSIIDAIVHSDDFTAKIMADAYDRLDIEEFANQLSELFNQYPLEDAQNNPN